MSDFECVDCKMLWRNYAEAMTKHVNLENHQKKAASAGYLSLFKDLTDQLYRAELQREECRFQITSHEQDQHGTGTKAVSTGESGRSRSVFHAEQYSTGKLVKIG
jgi:hypothetical protein